MTKSAPLETWFAYIAELFTAMPRRLYCDIHKSSVGVVFLV
jgi:hypothetical protein